MNTKTTDLEFAWLIGQQITDVDLHYPALLFPEGILYLECSWRLRDDVSILLGSSEFDEGLDRESIERRIVHLLVGRSVSALRHDPATSDLTLHVGDGIRLEAFNDSAVYKVWELSGPNGLLVTGTPKGSIAAWEQVKA